MDRLRAFFAALRYHRTFETRQSVIAHNKRNIKRLQP